MVDVPPTAVPEAAGAKNAVSAAPASDKVVPGTTCSGAVHNREWRNEAAGADVPPSTNTAENYTDAPNADLANAAAGGAHLANVAGTNPSTNTTVGANAEHVAEDTPVRDVAVTTSAESDVVATVQNEGTPRPGASVPATVVTVPQGATAATCADTTATNHTGKWVLPWEQRLRRIAHSWVLPRHADTFNALDVPAQSAAPPRA